MPNIGIPNTFGPDTTAQMSWLDANFAAGLVTFASIATAAQGGSSTNSLRSNTLTSLNQVYVEGYYTNADGGEGEFVLKSSDQTSTDNGGTIIVDAVGQRWYREMSGAAINWRWFGMTGSAPGAPADQSASLNNALAYASTLVPNPTTYDSGTVEVVGPSDIYPLNGGVVKVPTGCGVSCNNGIATFSLQTTGICVDTTVYASGNDNHLNGSVRGINFYGLGAGTPAIGLRINNAENFVLEHVRCYNFANPGVQIQSYFDGSGYTGSAISNSCTCSDVVVFNCALAVGNAAFPPWVSGAAIRQGQWELISGDSHRFVQCEVLSEATRTLSGALKLDVAWNLQTAPALSTGVNECKFVECYGSLSDQGFYLDGQSANNIFTNCRSDGNFAEHYFVQGSGNIWVGGEFNTNFLATDNTYATVSFGSDSSNNVIDDALWYNELSNSNWPSCFLQDFNTSTSRPNRLGPGNLYFNARSFFSFAPTATLSITMPDMIEAALAVNSGTPSLALNSGPQKNWTTVNTTSTAYANFLGGFPGQLLSLTCGDSSSSITNTAHIQTSTGSTVAMINGLLYKFRLNATGQKWIQN